MLTVAAETIPTAWVASETIAPPASRRGTGTGSESSLMRRGYGASGGISGLLDVCVPAVRITAEHGCRRDVVESTQQQDVHPVVVERPIRRLPRLREVAEVVVAETSRGRVERECPAQRRHAALEERLRLAG